MWLTLALKLPLIIQGTMAIVEKVKGAKGPEKKAAVLAAIPESISLLEFGAGKDVLNDAAVQQLLSVYIDAEAAALKAREALKAGLLAKASSTSAGSGSVGSTTTDAAGTPAPTN